jgi:hypothetical protein
VTVFDAALAEDLAGIAPGLARQGVVIGQEVARQILALRSNDGASTIMSYTPPNTDPGQWQPTPPDFSSAGNVHVPFITPFAVTSSSQFRPPPPPALTSPEYAAALNEVKALGSATGSTRTPDQTQVGLLWRLPLTNHQVWNRIAQDVAEARHASLAESARLFALMDMALNDGLETSNESKYHYLLWRPVTAIRRADEDGNPATEADPGWTTLHPTTPPYPAYASNASAIGAACATVLTGVFGGDGVPFDVHWDSYGFPGVTRSYAGFWAAADEMARSRVYGGIHFTFDCVAGQDIGKNVAHYVMDHFLLPRDPASHLASAEAAAPAPVAESLRADQVQPLLDVALGRWQAAGVDTSALRGIDVRIAGPGGLTPGAAADGAIGLGDNAAGWGWFVDRKSRSDSDFTRRGNQGERNRMDLVTVLTHEVGHLLGYEDEPGGVMQETSDAGTRRTTAPTTATDGLGAAPTFIAWTADAPWIDGFVSGTGKRG